MNLLKNPSFDDPVIGHGDQHRALVMTPDPASPQKSYWTQRGEINNAVGWLSWYVHDKRPPAHDPGNPVGWAEPEIRLAPHAGRQKDGLNGMLMFTFMRIHDGGHMQRVEGITPGTRLVAGGYAHAWSSQTDDPSHSEGVGKGAFSALEGLTQHNQATFRVGIDPTGGMDPFADTVIWGSGIHVYNGYAAVPEVEVVALGSAVTYFTRQRFLWPFKHNDGYWDGCYLKPVAIDPPPPTVPPITGGGYFVIETGSKLHPHAIGEAGAYDMLTYLRASDYTLPVVKIVASQAPKDLLAIRNLKQLSPGTRIIGRVIRGENGFNPEGWGIGLNAETYMAQFVKWARDYPEVAWWELWNEQDPPGAAGHVAMAKFAVDCMKIAEREGFKLALMSYSSGVPEPDEWRAIFQQTDFFQRAKAGGHILALHAYCKTGYAQAVADHLLRAKRDLYDALLIPAGLVVPYVLTEYSVDESKPGVGISDWTLQGLMQEYGKVDDLLAQQYYCLGASLYTFGQQVHYSHNAIWRDVAELILSKRKRQNALPPAQPETPDDGYDSTVLVVDWERVTDPEQRLALYMEAYARAIYVGPSHDEAREWPKMARSRTVELPGFTEADVAHVAFYHAANPKTKLVFRPLPGSEPPPATPDPAPDIELWFAYPTTHMPPVITSPYGPRNGGFHYGLDLRSSWRAWGTELLAAIDGEVVLVGFEYGKGYFGYQVQIMARHGSDTVVVRYAHLVDGGAYVKPGDRVTRGQKIGRPDSTGQSTGDHLHFDVRVNGQYVNPTALIRWPGETPQPPAPTQPLIGFNDPNSLGAGKWMRDEKLPGLLVVPLFLGGQGAALDFSANEAAGQRVIVNLRYSWSRDLGGGGTLPAPHSQERARFLDACVHTMKESRGVWGWEFLNEYNNSREFPAGYTLTPQDIVTAYNTVYARAAGARMAPGALDPFHATHGDPRDWLRAVYGGIAGAGFVTAHGYTRGPSPDLVGDATRFTDWPLEWQYRNYPGCVTALLEELPSKYRSLPVYITELNHLSKNFTDGNYGWVNDERAGLVVAEMARAGAHAGFEGLALYRWTGDEWAVKDNAHVLERVKRLLR